MSVLLTTAYLPPIEYIAAIAGGMKLSEGGIIPSSVYIESCENYQKQSWRNRCRILSSNGPENLNFPIVHRGGSHNGIPITEVEIDWSTPWLDRHEKAIASAYSTSAFFEYYKDELYALLESRPKTLFEMNLSLLRWLLKQLGIAADIRFTTSYGDITTAPASDPLLDLRECGGGQPDAVLDLRECGGGQPDAVLDLREVIHPKRPNTILQDRGLQKPYFQVFTPKYGFTEGLSVLDLLFNEGPASISYLR